ncbi:MAG: hypothetical protein ABJA82_12630 [Myxococcales bacterium]
MATGPHGINDIPIALVGGAAGRLKKTGYLVDAGAQPHQRVGCTIAHPRLGYGGGS